MAYKTYGSTPALGHEGDASAWTALPLRHGPTKSIEAATSPARRPAPSKHERWRRQWKIFLFPYTAVKFARSHRCRWRSPQGQQPEAGWEGTDHPEYPRKSVLSVMPSQPGGTWGHGRAKPYYFSSPRCQEQRVAQSQRVGAAPGGVRGMLSPTAPPNTPLDLETKIYFPKPQPDPNIENELLTLQQNRESFAPCREQPLHI